MLESISWQQILRKNFTDVGKLAEFLELDEKQCSQLLTKKKFPLNLPLRLAEKISKKTLSDPILRQFVPVLEENNFSEHFVLDPLQEAACRQKGKLLHKYHGRVLLICTNACAMHCRYCFRQNFDYIIKKDFEEELNYIRDDSSIQEVILSGGDPLSLPDYRLENLLLNISEIAHVKRIRFHTRFPIGIPERINQSLLTVLGKVRQPLWFVLHVNHPIELDETVISHLNLLRNQGVILLNQSVLLKDVNDSAEVLVELFEKLVNNCILPYYIHQLDRVSGAEHFEVSVEQGKELMKEVEKKVCGYALPKYVSEIPGNYSKFIIR